MNKPVTNVINLAEYRRQRRSPVRAVLDDPSVIICGLILIGTWIFAWWWFLS
jgi:hypothetical protein